MKRLTSIDAFHQWQKQLAEALDPKQKVVTICGGTGCSAFGATDVQKAFEE